MNSYKPLGTLLETLESGTRPKGGVAEISSGVPSIGGEHLDGNGGFEFKNLRYIPDEFYEKMSRGRIRKTDILIVKDGATTGKTSYVGKDFPLERAAVNEHIFILRPKPDRVLPRFLFFFLASPLGQRRILSNFHGAAIGGINSRFVDNVLVPNLPLPQQQKIVDDLDAAFELRQLRALADRSTGELIDAIFYDMFGDPIANPKCWVIKEAGDLMASCSYGTSTKGNDSKLGVPIIRMGNVTSKGQLDLDDLKYVELSDDDLEKHKLDEGDVLFNRTNSRELVGKTGLWDGRFKAVAASYFIRIRFDKTQELPQHFTTLMNLPSYKAKLAGMARGAIGQANINSKELQSIRFPVPPIPLQRIFALHTTMVRELVKDQSESRNQLEVLFQSLLHRAFEGEL